MTSNENKNLEMYTTQEMTVVGDHINSYFGDYKSVFHEKVSLGIHIDICVIPPSEDRNYITLVTMGMGAHKMNVPSDLAEHKLERAELVICLPIDWNLQSGEEENAWPTTIIRKLARLPMIYNSWLGWGHTVDNEEPFAKNTDLCGTLIIYPTGVSERAETCVLQSGEVVNFYQVIPLYREEMEYKQRYGTEALFNRMDGVDFVVDIHRPNVITSQRFNK